MNEWLDSVLTRDELHWLLTTLKRAKTPRGQQDQAWVSLVLHSGLKTSQVVSLTVRDARAAIRGYPVCLSGGKTVCFGDEATHWMQMLLDLLDDGATGNEDSPLLMSRLNGHLTNRALEQRLDVITKDNVDFIDSRRITVNALVATHRAARIVRAYSYLLPE